MKKFIISIVFVLLSHFSFCQSLSINNSGSPADASAILDVSSTNKGILIPRMSKVQRNAIASPATGLMVFQNSPDSIGFYYFTGSSWSWINSNNNGWATTGNSGTDTSINFIGTTDNMPLRFKQNNIWLGHFDRNRGNYLIGNNAGRRSGTASLHNIAIGDSALQNSFGGVGNIALGDKALKSHNDGLNNIAIGKLSMEKISGSSTYNIGIGYGTFFNASGGSNNTAVGYVALGNSTGGEDNIAIGRSSMWVSKFTQNNIAIGNNTLQGIGVNNASLTGHSNVAIGSGAMSGSLRNQYSVAIGFGALNGDTSGIGNVAVGSFISTSNNTGDYNVIVGTEAFQLHKTNDKNVAIGYRSMHVDTSGADNVAIGTFALGNSKFTSKTVAIGDSALHNNGLGATLSTQGANNTAVGSWALHANNTGSNNTAVGRQSGFNSVGSDNTFLGYATGLVINGSSNTIIGSASRGNFGGNENTTLGYLADAGNGTTMNNATAIGARAEVTVANGLVLGSVNGANGATATSNVGIGTTAPVIRLQVGGGIAATSTSISFTSAAVTETITVGNYTYLRISNNTATNKTITLSNGLTDGQILVVYVNNIGTGTVNFVDNATTNNTELNAAFAMGNNDTLTLIWDNTTNVWVELMRSNN